MKKTLKELLRSRLTKEELSRAVRSYDIIGDIAIIEIPKELEKREKAIASALLELHKNIKTVLKKGKHTGKYRKQNLKFLAGEKRKKTLYKENNICIELDVGKSYFSPRLSTERKRIAGQVKAGESILVMFSGVAPYPLVIAKNTKAKEIFGVEINPWAHRFALRNLELNKIKNVKLFLGDVTDVVPKLKKRFDRVLMPLPKGGEDYLGVAIKTVRQRGIIHFYDFLKGDEIPDSAISKIKKECEKQNKKHKILKVTKCGQQAARVYRVCVDFRVE